VPLAYIAARLMRLTSSCFDLGLADARELDAVRRGHAAAPRIPLVVLTGTDDEQLAALALKGAQDYLIKGQIDPRRLLRALRYAVERKRIEDALFAEKEGPDDSFSTAWPRP
jgi:DNA-binding NarL/FixJ family response regulator